MQVAPSVARRFHWQRGSPVRLKAGNRSVPVWIHPREARGLRCHPAVLQRLGLPAMRRGLPLGLRGGGQRARLGPIIGVFTNGYRSASLPFGRSTELLARLCRMGERRGYLVFVFTPRDIRWTEGRVLGYRPGEGGWVRRPFPLPDAVYDHVRSRTAERRLAVRRARGRLARIVRGRYFNRGFFHKWHVHRLLSGDPEIAPHLPETVRFAGTERLRRFLQRWPGAWLKPGGGSLGRGIVIVRRLGGNRYRVVARRRGRWRGRRVRGAAALRRALRRCMHKGSYVVQRELQLARYRGRPFDVRVLMQRTGDGSWRRTKLYARVASPRGVASNIAQGGEGLPFREVAVAASGTLPGHVDETLATMRHLAWRLVETLERGSNERLGEAALDLGIDEEGAIWFIEANSKPFRALETERGNVRVVRRALVRPLLYAAHLASAGVGRS